MAVALPPPVIDVPHPDVRPGLGPLFARSGAATEMPKVRMHLPVFADTLGIKTGGSFALGSQQASLGEIGEVRAKLEFISAQAARAVAQNQQLSQRVETLARAYDQLSFAVSGLLEPGSAADSEAPSSHSQRLMDEALSGAEPSDSSLIAMAEQLLISGEPEERSSAARLLAFTQRQAAGDALNAALVVEVDPYVRATLQSALRSATV